jgi:hypothetical protein
MGTFRQTTIPWAEDDNDRLAADGFDCAVAVSIVGECQRALAEAALLLANNGGRAPGVNLSYILMLLQWIGSVLSATELDKTPLQRETPQIEMNSKFFIDTAGFLKATADNIEAGAYSLPDIVENVADYSKLFRNTADLIEDLIAQIDDAKRIAS